MMTNFLNQFADVLTKIGSDLGRSSLESSLSCAMLTEHGNKNVPAKNGKKPKHSKRSTPSAVSAVGVRLSSACAVLVLSLSSAHVKILTAFKINQAGIEKVKLSLCSAIAQLVLRMSHNHKRVAHEE